MWYKYRDAMPSVEMKVGSQKLRVNIMRNYAGLDKILPLLLLVDIELLAIAIDLASSKYNSSGMTLLKKDCPYIAATVINKNIIL